MSIYFDKNKRLIIDKPYQAKEICVYCYINDDVKVDCKFVDFNKFYCKRCNNTWEIGKNQKSKSRSKKQQNDEDSLFSLALRKTEVKPTEDTSKNQNKIPIKKRNIYQKSGVKKCPACGAGEHTLVQDCPVFLGIKSIRKAEKQSKRKSSTTPAKQAEASLCPHCRVQVKAKKLPKHISEECQVANRKKVQQTTRKKLYLIDNKSINRQDKGKQEQYVDWSLCKHCNAKVRSKNLERHLFKIHGIRISKNYLQTEKKNILFGKNDANNDRHSDWYECNNVDSIDGSKYLGYLRREYENSQFGSFPLHDDYGDESWAD